MINQSHAYLMLEYKNQNIKRIQFIQECLIEYNAMGATGYYTRVLSRYGHAILFAPVTFPRSVKFRHS